MRKSIIIVCFFIFPFQVFSQFENTGFGLALNNSYPQTTREFPNAIITYSGQDETQSAFAYQVDIHSFYKVNPKLSIKTGLGFIKHKFLYEYQPLYSDQFIQSRPPGFRFSYLTQIYSSLNYISVPIGINYQINSKWEVGTGIQNNFLLSSYIYSIYYYVEDKESNYYRKNFQNDLYSSYVMSAYIETKYHFNLFHFPLSANMQLGYGISNYFSKEIPGTLRPITLNIGLAAKFKN